MPRIPRNSYQTSFFHIIVQGINKEYIFGEEKFLQSYRNLLITYEEKFKIKLLAYCIMNNHAHILVYTERIDEMSKYMKCINTVFAIFYNQEKQRTGYVFRDRYKSEAIMNEIYLIRCLAYIHNNPVKANIIERVNEYKYSSYNDYVYNEGIINQDKIELIFGTKTLCLKDFFSLHESKQYDFKDYDKDAEQIMEEFLIKNNVTLDKIKDSKSLMIEFIKELQKYNVTNKKMGEILGLDRFKVARTSKELKKSSVPDEQKCSFCSVPNEQKEDVNGVDYKSIKGN